MRASAETIKHETAVGGRSASGLHDGIRAGGEIDDAGLEFFLAQALGRTGGHQHGLDAELAKTLGKQNSGRLFQIDEGGSGRPLLGRGSGCQDSAKGFFHVIEADYQYESFIVARLAGDGKTLRGRMGAQKCHYLRWTGEWGG